MIQTERLTITALTYKELLRYVFGRKGSIINDETEVWAINTIVKPTHEAIGEDYLYHTIWVAKNSENELVGEIWLKGLPTELGLVEWADFVMPQFRNQGYCTEMIKGFFTWVIKDERINFIVASVDEDNISSKKSLLKNGVRQIGYNEGRCTFLKQLKF